MPTRTKKPAPKETEAPKEPKLPEATKLPEANEPDDDFDSGPKVVSLNSELSTVRMAVRGAQLLADAEAYGFMDEEGEMDSPLCISALLAIVGARIELVQGVIRQEVNPGLLWGPHNAVTEGEFRPVGDVYLLEWNRA